MRRLLIRWSATNHPLSNIIFFVASVIYIITAIKSSGFHHADEHYQIIDFARYKMGDANKGNLAWEFHYAMRSGIQPGFCYVIFSTLKAFGLNDPYMYSMVLRIISAIFALIAIRVFIINTTYKISSPSLLIPYILLSYFLWFTPYLGVRFSSENWSGLFFLIGLSFIISLKKHNKAAYFYIGLFLGISILFRYQLIIAVSFVLLWEMIVNKERIQDLLIMTSTVVFVLIVGLLIDRWLYGYWSCTFYNYIYFNLFKGMSSSFGISPWYQYFIYLINGTYFIPGIIIIASVLIILFKQPKNLLIWCVVPFLLIHCVIPHKELRFIFPLIYIVPFLIFEAFSLLRIQRYYKHILKTCIIIYIPVNIVLMMLVSFKSASNGRTLLTQYINHNYESDVNLIYTSGSNVYNPWDGVYSSFYTTSKITFTETTSIWNPELLDNKQNNKINLLVMHSSELLGKRTDDLVKRLNLKLVKTSVPFLTFKMSNTFDKQFNGEILLLYEFK